MKSIIGKSRVQNGYFPKNVIIANEEITEKQFLCEHRYKSGS